MSGVGVTVGERAEAARLAKQSLQLWEEGLSLRISLQKLLDLGNRLPNNVELHMEATVQQLESILFNQYQLLSASSVSSPPSSSSLTRALSSTNGGRLEWTDLEEQHDGLKEKWMDVLNKWYSRLQYGHKDSAQKMKTFKQTFWDQIDQAIADPNRVREKTRCSWAESPRINKEVDNNKNDDSDADDEDRMDEENSSIHKHLFDEEVYDDKLFYSMLLKTFITQVSANGLNGTGAGHRDDLEAIRKHKQRSKSKVERKASKGRKIRYTVHPKLQNFMFPVPNNSTDLDVDKLYQSLFQS